ncbi:MAG: orotate phosphoribosyltransferase [Candidatus Omnitrophica bacterium]|nr:orotate phosphoribosyltransferase [Candidatus Omnitrophota bacterium]
METTENLKNQLFALIKEKAYHEGEIKLASGKTSHYYIDARAVTLSAKGAYLVGCLVFDMVSMSQVDAVGGPTLGADPIVGALAAVSFQNNHPMDTFLIRKNPKSHGRMLQVEGPELQAEDEVVLVDDVATTGGSLVDAIEVLKKMNISARKAIVIVDREEGAKENLAKLGCEVLSIFKASEFFSAKYRPLKAV